MRRGLSSELDEMWSFVKTKAHPRWLWHAIDHTGKVLAYVFGRLKTPSLSSNSSWSHLALQSFTRTDGEPTDGI